MKAIRAILVAIMVALVLPLPAKEGMWLPILLGSLNEGDMQSMGLKLSAEDIYSVNQSSLKDAIVNFGGCTAELISSDGLLLTNHHCGLSWIQKQSSVENNYLDDGFWAQNYGQELQNNGLRVTFLVRMEDVTEKILGGLAADMSEEARTAEIAKRIEAVSKAATEGTSYEAQIRPFYYGNEYYMLVTEVFTDVRLVGAPPSSVGKYGGDTDNWLWPRHTGDFSLFRIYTAPDGSPADYAEENVPMKPKKFFPISLKGVNVGDFTMVYGYPGRTQEYLTSYAVEMIMEVQDPLRIGLRDKRLAVMAEEMDKSEKVKIQYFSKQSRVSNGYKKWKGEIRGLKRADAIAKKRAFEAEFQKRVDAKPEWKAAYGSLLTDFKAAYEELLPSLFANEYFYEGGYSIEVVRAARRAYDAVIGYEEATDEEAKAQVVADFKDWGERYFKDYHAPIDRKITEAILRSYEQDMKPEQRPEILQVIAKEIPGGAGKFADYIFSESLLTDETRFAGLIEDFSVDKIMRDPSIQLMAGLVNDYQTIRPVYQAQQEKIDRLTRTYMKALREVFPEKTFYPDANSTLRLTYGKVQGMEAKDGVRYKHYTTLQGVVDKYVKGDREFDLPERMIDLQAEGDYGKYAQDGELWVCFLASNHTSGGNSGSPVINGEGQLIGLNFDRNWEGTMSDIYYDVNQCRNISVDIRYVLWVIDKYAGAGHLLKNMELVE
ncbi:MAG: S46 family peptidase [Bacteroidota bacterium]